MLSWVEVASDIFALVQIHPVETREGGMALQFEHPTIAGVTVGGWMNRADAKPKIVQVRRSCAQPPHRYGLQCRHCIAGLSLAGSIY